nr:hypothetical protein [Jiangella rhizosphaerae]
MRQLPAFSDAARSGTVPRSGEALGVAHFQQDVDERASVEVIAAEPGVEHVEDRQQPLLGGGAEAFGLRLDQNVALATPDCAMTSSTPTSRTPRRENNP